MLQWHGHYLPNRTPHNLLIHLFLLLRYRTWLAAPLRRGEPLLRTVWSDPVLPVCHCQSWGLVLNLKEKKAVLNPTIKPELGVSGGMETPASIGIHGVGMCYTAVSGSIPFNCICIATEHNMHIHILFLSVYNQSPLPVVNVANLPPDRPSKKINPCSYVSLLLCLTTNCRTDTLLCVTLARTWPMHMNRQYRQFCSEQRSSLFKKRQCGHYLNCQDSYLSVTKTVIFWKKIVSAKQTFVEDRQHHTTWSLNWFLCQCWCTSVSYLVVLIPFVFKCLSNSTL